MNFVCRRDGLGQERCGVAGIFILATFAFIFLGSGCSDGVRELSSQEILEFNRIDAGSPSVDMGRVVRAKHAAGPYRVVPDDVLELTMPSILQVVTAESAAVDAEASPLMCRIRGDGTISLPVVGGLFVAGHSLAEIEEDVVAAYYPTYTQSHPGVFVRVAEFKTYKVSVTGAVTEPGVYELRGDQMSLVALIREAQGIIPEGASIIRIERESGANSASAAMHLKPTGIGTSFGAPRKKSVSLAAFMDSHDVQSGQNALIHLSFQPQEQGSTIGYLSIKRQDRIIVQERINLGSEAQRFATLGRAVQIDPSVSVVDLNAKLTSLVSLLYGHSRYNPSLQFASAAIEAPGETDSLDTLAEDIQRVEQYRDKPVSTAEQTQDTIVLPVKGTNIPFADIALHEGDRVVVERLHMPLFAVIGLVRTPGNYEYPPGAQYNLVQAIAFAGGLDPGAEPRYVTIYRLRQDGSIARVALKLKDGSRLTDELNIPLKRGDIVSVEHTPRTRKNQFLRDVFRVTIGTYFGPDDFWD